MEIGLSVYDISGAELIELDGRRGAGFSTLWLGEHIVSPVVYEAEHPTTGFDSEANRSHLTRIVDPDTKLIDPLVRAGGGRCRDRAHSSGYRDLPRWLRHPLSVARITLTLQDVAGGRLLARGRLRLARRGICRSRRLIRRTSVARRGSARRVAPRVGRR